SRNPPRPPLRRGHHARLAGRQRIQRHLRHGVRFVGAWPAAARLLRLACIGHYTEYLSPGTSPGGWRLSWWNSDLLKRGLTGAHQQGARLFRPSAYMDVLTRDIAQEERTLTQVAFARLLEWLDDGVDTQGERYLEMRRRLVSYFDRRNRPFADDLADETLNRIGRTLEKSGSIAVTPPARYCYVVARFVLLEDIRRGRKYVQVDEARPLPSRGRVPAPDSEEPAREQGRRLDCLDRCLATLKPE